MARNLRGKIDELYSEWSGEMEPSPSLAELIKDKEQARPFFHGIRRQMATIRKRSQKSEDGQITVYDAVLARLWDKGHSMKSYGLFEFYMAEYLGTKDCTPAEINVKLAAHIAAQRILDAGVISKIPDGPDQDKSADRAASTPAIESIEGPEAVKPPHLDKLIDTYKKAKDDYYILEVTESHGKQTNNVRFLRDTAENLLRYLKSVDKDHELINELEDIIKDSQTRANELAGGRKRKFERTKYRNDSGSRGSPSPSPYRPFGYYGETYGGFSRPNYWDRYVPTNNWNHGRRPDLYRP